MAEPRDPTPAPADRQGGERTPEETQPPPIEEEDPRLTPGRDERGEVQSGVEQVDRPGRSAEEP